MDGEKEELFAHCQALRKVGEVARMFTLNSDLGNVQCARGKRHEFIHSTITNISRPAHCPFFAASLASNCQKISTKNCSEMLLLKGQL